ncbi:MAG: hypothetical protein KJO07_23695, partial [Deltaproteobacteria bacterium]|nr:hypothetical protein [Deltaproteobacteria bacterium]
TVQGSDPNAAIADAALGLIATKVAAGDNHSCVLAGAAVSCWGSNGAGQLGLTVDNAPVDPAPGTAVAPALPAVDALDLAAGANHSCALMTGGGVFCWGANGAGQAGQPEGGNQVLSPVQVTLPAAATAVFAADNNTCALLDDSRVFCWGSNRFQQLGLGPETLDSPSPVEIADVLATTVSVSNAHVCVITPEGATRCWGDNRYTELGTDRVELAGSATQTELVCASAE